MSDTRTLTLTDFLLARIAEDEAAILEGWDSDGKARIATMWPGEKMRYTTVASDHGDGHWVADGHEVPDPRHVHIMFDPVRVLAECEAKRGLIQFCEDCPDPMNQERVEGFLALPYADHPDYDEAWRP